MNTILRRAVPAAALALSLALMLALAGQGRADPGHEIRIEELNKIIAENPNSPELYYQRGINYRDIPKPAEARADFEKALSIRKDYLPAERELARLDEAAGHRKEAIERLERAIAAATPETAIHVPSCHEALTDFYLSANRNEEALASAQKVFAITPHDASLLDLYLLRSEAQRRLGKHDDRVRDLLAAHEKLKSVVLRNAWLEALIDAGRTAEALPEVDKEMAGYRFKSSWLIRRARIYLQDGRKTEAAADLDAALAEINQRILPENPELFLVCDRALIHALQGKLDEARKELADAKKRGAFPWAARAVESVLEAEDRKAAGKERK